MRILALGTCFLFLLTTDCFAANRYWISTTAGNWSNPANWSGASVPGSGDVAIFNGASASNGICTLDVAVTLNGLQIITGYTGSINLAGNNLTINGASSNLFSANSTISNSGAISSFSITSSSNVNFSSVDIGANVNLIVSLSGAATFTAGAGRTFYGEVTVSAPSILLNGSTFEGIASFTKTGSTADSWTGGNVFKQLTTITNSGAYVNNTNNARIITPNSAQGDTFNDLELNYNNSGNILLAYAAGSNTLFNGNITVASPRTAQNAGANVYGIFIGLNGTCQLANGKKILESPSFFFRGTLQIAHLTQDPASTTSQDLHFNYNGDGGDSPAVNSNGLRLHIGPQTTFYGDVTFQATSLQLDNSTFMGTSNKFSKLSGGADVNCIGGNVFGNPVLNNSTTTILNGSTTSVFTLGYNNSDDFNGDVIFYKSTANSPLIIGFTGTTTISGDLIFDTAVSTNVTPVSATQLTSISLDGNGVQSIKKIINNAETILDPVFASVTIAKSTNNVILNTPITITSVLTLSNGDLITTSTSVPTLTSTSSTVGGSNSSYVDGPIRKTGGTAFSFPVGQNNIYRPIAISASGAPAAQFEAQYFNTSARTAIGTATDPAAGYYTISGCEYWALNRTIGVSNVNVTLGWNSPECPGTYVGNLPDLRVARWNGSQWMNHGNSNPTGNEDAGTITTSSPVTSFSPFALATTTNLNPLPVELISFNAVYVDGAAELSWKTASEHNNNYFTIERSENGIDFTEIDTVKGAGTSVLTNKYTRIDRNPIEGLSYYRLRQTDFDGRDTYHEPIAFHVKSSSEESFTIYPVPANGTLFLNKSSDVKIFNSSGIELFHGFNVKEVDISKFLPGFYYIINEDGNRKKLIVR